MRLVLVELALQRHLLDGLDLFALDLAHDTILFHKHTNTKAHSNNGMSVDLAHEASGIAFSTIDLPISETDSYSDPASEQSSPLRDPHSHHVGHANLDRDGHANIDRVSGLVLSQCSLKDCVGASQTGRSKHYRCVVERGRRCVRYGLRSQFMYHRT